MATLVGTNTEFKDALYALCELNYDAIKAYEAAINRIENQSLKSQLIEFKNDHQRHVANLTRLLTNHQVEAPKDPSMKEYLAQGKVVLVNLLGDKALLKAMLSNEKDTNTAYDRASSHKDAWENATEILQRGWTDERRHKAWIETSLEALQ